MELKTVAEAAAVQVDGIAVLNGDGGLWTHELMG
jgi:hypothetical protein